VFHNVRNSLGAIIQPILGHAFGVNHLKFIDQSDCRRSFSVFADNNEHLRFDDFKDVVNELGAGGVAVQLVEPLINKSISFAGFLA
jgi:hypothetical protein